MTGTALASDPMVAKHLEDRERAVGMIENLKQIAMDRDGFLNESERAAIESAKERIARSDEQLELISDNLAMTDEARNRLAHVSRAIAPAPSYSRAGQVLYDLLHLNEADSASRFRQAMNRAAEHMGTEATKTVPVAGDLGGLVIIQTVGAIIDPYPSASFASALGLTESPNAMVFMRPRIVDPDFATAVGPQGSAATLGFEKAELPSKKFDVTAEPVSLATIGTYLNISQQLISLQAGALDLIMSHQIKRLGWGIDNALLTEMVKSTGKVTLAADADSAALISAIFTASANVYTATGSLAQWIVMGPLGWARLGSMVDLAGRPLFPAVGPANALGTANASSFFLPTLGLTAIVTPAITDDTFWVGNDSAIEGYVYRFPVLEAIEPSVLGRQVAVSAAVAGYRPFPNAAQHLAP